MGMGQNTAPKKRGRPTRSRKAAYSPASDQDRTTLQNGLSTKTGSGEEHVQVVGGASSPSGTPHSHIPTVHDEAQNYTIEDENLSPFSSLLRHILRNDGGEVARIAHELDVADNTVYRWMNGSSEPRAALLKRLLEVLPEHRGNLTYAINLTFPDALEALSPGLHEVPKAIYRQVLELMATTQEDDARHWQISQAVFESALLHLDAERHGMAVTYASLMPIHEDGIHSLRESIMRGNSPWPFNLESRVYLGSTTLAGTAAMLQRPQTWSESSQDDRLLVDVDEFERSAGACPVMRAGRISGVLIISSTRHDFYTDPVAVQSLVEYAQLLSLAMREQDFFPTSSLHLRPMPELRWQRAEINRSLVARVIAYARKHNMARLEAERRVLLEMEMEFEEMGRVLIERRAGKPHSPA